MPVLFYQTERLPSVVAGRCRDLCLKQFRLEIVPSRSSDYFDCSYYHSYTVDAY